MMHPRNKNFVETSASPRRHKTPETKESHPSYPAELASTSVRQANDALLRSVRIGARCVSAPVPLRYPHRHIDTRRNGGCNIRACELLRSRRAGSHIGV